MDYQHLYSVNIDWCWSLLFKHTNEYNVYICNPVVKNK